MLTKGSERPLRAVRSNNELPSLVPIMNTYPFTESPPVDFVAFLAERSGLSQEAAEHRLEHWFGEYHASCQQSSADTSFESAHALG